MTSLTQDRVALHICDGVADVRLNRPDKMNALDDAMFEALRQTGERLKVDASVRAVVLSGEGRAFCAGLDTSNFGRMAAGERTGERLINGVLTSRGANMAQQAVMVWREIRAPVIAAVHGAALGGGLQLALGPELRFVAPDARLGLVEVRWGLVPDMAGVALLRGLVRGDVARDLIYSGRIVSGEAAATLGLATRVCADPLDEALTFAREVATRSPDAIRAGKRLMELAEHGDESSILQAEAREQARLIGSPNQKEAVRAALETRAAIFDDAGSTSGPTR